MMNVFEKIAFAITILTVSIIATCSSVYQEHENDTVDDSSIYTETVTTTYTVTASTQITMGVKNEVRTQALSKPTTQTTTSTATSTDTTTATLTATTTATSTATTTTTSETTTHTTAETTTSSLTTIIMENDEVGQESYSTEMYESSYEDYCDEYYEYNDGSNYDYTYDIYPSGLTAQTVTLYTSNGNSDASWTNIYNAIYTLNQIGYIAPYSTFSWLNDVGYCNSWPYVEAGVYIGNQPGVGVGGGICFPSTVLMQVEELCGMSTLEKHPHTLPVSYNWRPDPETYGWAEYEASLEREAAIDCDSGTDLVFYNPYSVGFYITAYANQEYASCSITLTPEW
mgnify:CR=1 FL=1